MFDIFNFTAGKRQERLQQRREAEAAKLGVTFDVETDGTITFRGSLDLRNRKLRRLPDLSGATVEGDFLCGDNQLTSLKGAPKVVTGNFDCGGNSLTSLRGGPEEVGSCYGCARNFLADLKGAPREVASMDCSDNNLLSLAGAPEKVRGDFDCDNTTIFNLAQGPREVGGVFSVTGGRLETLKYAPQKFHCLVTDFGNFQSADEIPEELGGKPPKPAAAAAPKALPVAPPSNDGDPGIALDAAIRVQRPLSLVRKK
jgi:hypothetical protein